MLLWLHGQASALPAFFRNVQKHFSPTTTKNVPPDYDESSKSLPVRLHGIDLSTGATRCSPAMDCSRLRLEANLEASQRRDSGPLSATNFQVTNAILKVNDLLLGFSRLDLGLTYFRSSLRLICFSILLGRLRGTHASPTSTARTALIKQEAMSRFLIQPRAP